jgi:HlyD family secretion protein
MAQADVSVERSEVASNAARRDADRARSLERTGAIAKADLDDAEVAERIAAQDLEAARRGQSVAAAEVAAARATLAGVEGGGPRGAALPVTSPAAGEVLRVLREDEGPVAAGEQLLEIGDPRSLEIVVDVLSGDAARIRPGMPARIEAWGGERTLPARVTVVEPSAFTKVSALGVEEQRVNIILVLEPQAAQTGDLERKEAELGDQFRVEVRIILWHGDQVPAIPTTALFRHEGSWAVYVLEDGRARLRTVDVGHRGRASAEIVRGLDVGAEVILHPGDRVEEGARVERREGGT